MDNSDSDTELFDNWGSLFIGVVEEDENSFSEKEWTIGFKIDSGVQSNIVPENCFRTLKNK